MSLAAEIYWQIEIPVLAIEHYQCFEAKWWVVMGSNQ
jgi:hypothetical protein